MRSFVVVAVVASWSRPVSAQMLPGTNDDVAGALVLVPSVVPIPLHGFAVRGGTPEDTLILVDGFEIPRLQHFLGLRSVILRGILADAAVKTAPDVSLGRASTAVSMQLGMRSAMQVEANTFDVSLLSRGPRSVAGFRYSISDPITNTGYLDGQGRWERGVGGGGLVFASAVASIDGIEGHELFDDQSRELSRVIVGASYTDRRWSATMALSGMYSHDSRKRGQLAHYDTSLVTLDTRGEIVHTRDRAAGLTQLEWRLGEQTTIAHHDIDVAWSTPPREGSPQPQHPAADDTSTRFVGTFWTPDAALWTSLAANLAPRIRATTGLRVDMFGRGDDVATQPRGELYFNTWPRTRFAIAAGAYRRPPQRGDELFTADLDPERSTQVTTRVEHEHQALTVQGNAYYIDRSRLVIRDGFGVLRNTGSGTSIGVELSAQLKMLGWFASGSASLSRSTRKDFPTGAERRSQFDQPLRLDLLVTKRVRRWQVGGRFQLAAGLPTTSIQESVYDADRDVYEPIFGRTYDERLPYRYEIDVRIDRTFSLTRTARLAAFADVRLSTSTLGYRDSFDYKQRSAITMPIVPYVGLRGSL